MKVSGFLSSALIFAATGVLTEPTLERGTYLVEGPAACGNCHSPMGPEAHGARGTFARHASCRSLG